ncbi:hypothetical protein [Halorientalis halophila]|uniref:hypothetical protein n=1 Tax=Halorientalis halophila TaxID=3108499 RepID=UPI00300A3031
MELPQFDLADLVRGGFGEVVDELDSSARLTGRVTASLADLSIGDRVELRVCDPETVGIDPDFDPSYEEEWPIHVFDPV